MSYVPSPWSLAIFPRYNLPSLRGSTRLEAVDAALDSDKAPGVVGLDLVHFAEALAVLAVAVVIEEGAS